MALEGVERVIREMHAKLEEPLTLHHLAQVASASRFHFHRTFRRITGMPPTRFLYALRIARARELLCSTEMNVTDICYEVGYNSLGTFTRRFTQLFGVSPTRLRSVNRSCNGTALQLVKPALTSANGEPLHCVSGAVIAPPEFQGPALVGLFRHPIPRGMPMASALLPQGGPYQLNVVPDGTYYIFGLAWTLASDPANTFTSEPAWRAGGQRISIGNGVTRGSTVLWLRPSTLFDPPILLAAPLLLAQVFSTHPLCG